MPDDDAIDAVQFARDHLGEIVANAEFAGLDRAVVAAALLLAATELVREAGRSRPPHGGADRNAEEVARRTIDGALERR